MADTIGDIGELRRAARTFYGDVGAWAYDVWEELNDRHFGGRLTPGPITWGLTPYGGCIGYYDAVRNEITLHPSLIRPGERAWNLHALLGRRYTTDVLIHEMLHQKLHLIDGLPVGDQHNTDPWCAEIARLSAELGLTCPPARPVKPRRIRDEDGKSRVARVPLDGHLAQMDLARWPHSLRPRAYYEAEVRAARARLERRAGWL